MARCRFVQPETVTLDLSDSDWVEVKKRLTVGEERAAFQQIVGEVNSAGWRRPNVEMMGLAEVQAYIVDWSFRGADGKRVEPNMAAIKALDKASYNELETAIQKHIEAMDAEENARKNVSATESESGATSPSVG